MLTKLNTATIHGLQVIPIECEVDIGGGGRVDFDIVGLGDTMVQEAIARINRALQNSGYPIPFKRITVNLAPADIKKTGTLFDLPIALGVLYSNNDIDGKVDHKSLFFGELALDGSLRSINGVLSLAIFAKEYGYENLYIPAENAKEASLIKGLNIYPVHSISQLIKHLNGVEKISVFDGLSAIDSQSLSDIDVDFEDIKGQVFVKRAITIAATGHHNILMNGSPGSGKTMIAKAMRDIMSDMTESEVIEVTKLYSVAGLIDRENPLIVKRPFRVVHHTASNVSIVGGGKTPKPGEITLAHRGILFLDEIAEFQTSVLEVLRQPIEDKKITINRASGSLTYPAQFVLVAAMNPCPCGYYNVPNSKKECTCTPQMISKYSKKLSGPLLDRIDLYVTVSPIDHEKLSNKTKSESSKNIKLKVQKAKDIQLQRFKDSGFTSNTEMGVKDIEKFCNLDKECNDILKVAMNKYNLSARSYHRLLKVSRTIADLDDSENIKVHHITEALQYRKIN